MLKRLFEKTHRAITKEGIFTFLKLFFVFFDRKLRPNKYFHFVKVPKTKKKILFVSGEPINSTSFYRCEIPQEQLKELGVEADIIYKDYLTQEYIESYEHIIWYRLPFKKQYKEMMGDRPIIFSVDDLIFDTDSVKTQPWIGNLHPDDREKLLEDSRGMNKFLMNSNAVIVSTGYLAAEAKRFNKIETYVYRNSFSKKQYNYAKWLNVESDPNTLVFASGSYTQNENLEMISEDIESLLFKRKSLKLKLIGRVELPKNLRRFSDRISFTSFKDPNRYIGELKAGALVLMPLIKNDHNESKSELRAIQAGLVSVPIIATDTHAYSSVISDGNNGFLVKDNKDWYKKLDGAFNYDLKEMGNRLHFDVKSKYNSKKLAKGLLNFLKNYE